MRLFRVLGLLSVVCGLLTFAYAAEKTLLLDFEYTDAATAQRQWLPQAKSAPVSVILHSGERPGNTALLLPCDFSRLADRGYWDRDIELNLVAHSAFTLSVYATKTKPLGRGTIYFKSGDGWYGANFSLAQEGWQEVKLSKAGFWTEGQPRGWHKVDRIRLSFSPDSDEDIFVGIDDLVAVTDTIAVVRGEVDREDNWQEARYINGTAKYVARLLERQGLDFNFLGAENLDKGALAGARVVVFPWSPRTSKKVDRILRSYIKSGGKVIFCYSLPESVHGLLGVKSLKYQRAEPADLLHAMRVKPGTLGSLSGDIVQSSHNAMIPEPGEGTQVLATWVNEKGQGTFPAVILNANGAFIGHVLRNMDEEKKGALLLELMARLSPGLWPEFSLAAMRGAGMLGGMADVAEIEARIAKNYAAGTPAARRAMAERHRYAARRLLGAAAAAAKAGQHRDAVAQASGAKGELNEALLLSFPSRREFRAAWCHSAEGIYGWEWDRAVKWLKGNGIDNLVGNFLWGGGTSYPSKVLPLKENAEGKGDLLKECLAACRKYGVKLHVWKVNWELWWGSPEEWVEKMRSDGRLQKSRKGEDRNALCPSHPENFVLEVESMLEVARNYDVDGVHFDYIRYPGPEYCFCDGCRARFAKHLGKKIKKWPRDVIADGEDEKAGKYADEYAAWRRSNITRLVKAVSEKARKIRPGIKISAAVFSDYPYCTETVAQDWVAWVKQGYLDFVCPMNYTNENYELVSKVRKQLELVAGKVPLYPGIGASSPGLPPAQIAMQIQLTRELGAPGFIIFEYSLGFAENKLAELKKGVLAP